MKEELIKSIPLGQRDNILGILRPDTNTIITGIDDNKGIEENVDLAQINHRLDRESLYNDLNNLAAGNSQTGKILQGISEYFMMANRPVNTEELGYSVYLKLNDTSTLDMEMKENFPEYLRTINSALYNQEYGIYSGTESEFRWHVLLPNERLTGNSRYLIPMPGVNQFLKGIKKENHFVEAVAKVCQFNVKPNFAGNLESLLTPNQFIILMTALKDPNLSPAMEDYLINLTDQGQPIDETRTEEVRELIDEFQDHLDNLGSKLRFIPTDRGFKLVHKDTFKPVHLEHIPYADTVIRHARTNFIVGNIPADLHHVFDLATNPELYGDGLISLPNSKAKLVFSIYFPSKLSYANTKRELVAEARFAEHFRENYIKYLTLRPEQTLRQWRTTETELSHDAERLAQFLSLYDLSEIEAELPAFPKFPLDWYGISCTLLESDQLLNPDKSILRVTNLGVNSVAMQNTGIIGHTYDIIQRGEKPLFLASKRKPPIQKIREKMVITEIPVSKLKKRNLLVATRGIKINRYDPRNWGLPLISLPQETYPRLEFGRTGKSEGTFVRIGYKVNKRKNYLYDGK